MMYDVYWYCQMKKKEWLWNFWKRDDYENFEKRGGGGSREKGEGGNEIHAPCACVTMYTNDTPVQYKYRLLVVNVNVGNGHY
jgi:hypothetical protein